MNKDHKQKLLHEVEKVLDVLRGGIELHGGGVEVVDVDSKTGTVRIRLQGACVGCPLSDMTFRSGVEETLKQMIPEIKEVIQVD